MTAGIGATLKAHLVTSFECDSTHCFFAESIRADREGNLSVVHFWRTPNTTRIWLEAVRSEK